MESDERIAYIISRKIFVYSLETLLTKADINVKQTAKDARCINGWMTHGG